MTDKAVIRLFNLSSLGGAPCRSRTSMDPKTRRVIGIAWELGRAGLRVSGRADVSDAMLAAKILELAKAGERNPDLLCEQALSALRAGARVQSVRLVAGVWRPDDVPSSR